MSGRDMKDTLEGIARAAVPEDTELWPRIAARLGERRSVMTTLRARPAMAILLAAIAILALGSASYAAGVSLGYVPGIGFIENRGDLRVLAKPAAVTRDGITLTVTQAIVYSDHVRLVYEVSGVPADAQTSPGDATPGPIPWLPAESDPRLRLPDGTIIPHAKQDIYEQQPTFITAIPSGVDRLTFLLNALPHTRPGAAPTGWEVPLALVRKPAREVVGEAVTQPAPQPTAPGSIPPTGGASPAGGTDATIAPFEPDYRFGGAIGMARPAVSRQGDQVQVCLKWLSIAPVTIDYNVFVHVVSEGGEMLGQMDFSPQEGRAPTSSWLPGEARAECVTLDAPGLPPAGWHVTVGLYDPARGVRAAVVDEAGQVQPNDEVVAQ